MKKLSVFLLLAGCSTFLNAQSQVRVPEIVAVAGSEVTVPIFLQNGSDLSAVQFSLSYDSVGLTAAAGSIVGGDTLEDHSLAIHQTDGKVSVLIFSTSLSSFRFGDGTLLTIKFDVSDGLPIGSRLALILTGARGADGQGVSSALAPVSGGITITEGNPLPVDGQNELLFPQIANGDGIRILLVLVNRSTRGSVTEARFFKPDGSPFELSLTDGRIGDRFIAEVPAGGSAFLASDGTGAASAGYARVSATNPVGGVLLFTIFDGSGSVLAEAGVTDSPPGRHFSIPVLLTPTSNTGIAVANVSMQDGTLTLVLREESGDERSRIELPLPAGVQTAQYLTQFFESDLAGLTEFQGSIELLSDADVTVVALKQEGLLLTTFPVVVLEEGQPQ